MQTDTTRYSRHELLRQLGPEGQKRVQSSRVLVAGLGALGALISSLLARAGVGFLRIVDYDAPEMHNLHRQILYDEADVAAGVPKAEAALRKLREANSSITVEALNVAIQPGNVAELTDGVDLVVDALDNAATRYLLNDRIVAKGIPYVFGGAVETSGNVMTILPGITPCLRCLWPDPNALRNHATAADVGVLSAVATAVASIEVAEAIKILSGSEEDRLSGLLVLDIWKGTFYSAQVEPRPSCVCRNASQ